jgi:hypothetical protein
VADVGKVSISYVTDPFCPWSWAVEPSWRRLQAEFVDEVSITYVISGLGGAQPDAVAEQADAGPFLRRLREAIFLERRRVDRGDVLLDLARETSPRLDLETLTIAFGSNGPVESLGADFDRAAGVPRPSLRIGEAVVDGRAPYGEWRAAVVAAGGEPRDGALDVDSALRRFGACTTAEIAALCDLPGPRAPAELWRLALEWRVRPRPVLGGELWALNAP